jgi:NAD(P)-dependent dehydrogenase (short-subunit alcohol dehydrogenase family)
MSDDTFDPLANTRPFQITKKIWRDVPPELSPEAPENSAEGKIIVITGGGSGIGAVSGPLHPIGMNRRANTGQGSAKIWVRAGAEAVVIAGRRKDVLDGTAAELKELAKEKGVETKILTVQTDITKEADTNNLFEQVKKTFGRAADVVLSNAGAISAIQAPHKESIKNWWSVYEINVLGTHNLAVSYIKSQETPDKPVGTFISVNTNISGIFFPGVSAYSTSKLAVQRYVEYLDIGMLDLLAWSMSLTTYCRISHTSRIFNPTWRRSYRYGKFCLSIPIQTLICRFSY